MQRNDQILYDDAIDLLCGKEIASGSSRTVFECTLMPGYVVKVEKDCSKHRNIMEFQAWESVCHVPEIARYFAKIHMMSANGRILIMEKTVRPGPNDWPDKLPVFITDRKKDNFGMIRVKSVDTGEHEWIFVCHDYGHHCLHENGMSKRMSKANFWELE